MGAKTLSSTRGVEELQAKAIRRYALPVVLAALLLISIFSAALLIPLPQWPSWGWDVAVFRAGAKALIAGANPYTASNIPRFADQAELASIPYYTYSPFFAILIAPLTVLPPWFAFRLWFWGNLILYMASIFLIKEALQWTLTPKRLLFLSLTLVLYAPLRTLLIIGQSGIVMLFFLSLSFWLIKRLRPGVAGVVLSQAFFKPHLVLVLPFLALRRQWRLLLAFGLTSILTLLPFLPLVDDWVRTMFSTRAANLAYGCLPFSSLGMLVECTFGATHTKIIALILYGLVAGLVLIFIRQQADPSSTSYDLQFGLVVIATVLLLDNVRVADLILLVFPFIILLSSMRFVVALRTRFIIYWLVAVAYVIPYAALTAAVVTQNPMWNMPIWYTFTSIFLGAAIVLLIVQLDYRETSK